MYTDPEIKKRKPQKDILQSKLYRLYTKQIDEEQIDAKKTCFPLPLDNCDRKLQCNITWFTGPLQLGSRFSHF